MPTTRTRIGQALGLADEEGARVLPALVVLAFVGWLPTVLLAAHQAYATGEWPAVALAFETHARYLVALPFLVFGDRLLHERMVRSARTLVSSALIRPEDIEHYRAIAARAQRLRVSGTGAAVCFTIALTMTVAAMPVLENTASRWDGIVGLSLFRFVLLLEVWRWAVWALFLGRVSRFDLALVATHPDRAGGLGFLRQPSEGFSVVVFAAGTVIAARWSTLVFREGLPFLAFRKDAVVYALLMVGLGIMPLLPFTDRLLRLRLRALREYGAFACDYCAQFEERWIRRPRSEAGGELLGTSDIQALADLANSFGIVERTSVFLVTPRLAATLALAALMPMVPLFMTVLPIEVILPRLLKVL
jgi:hypothetical protein